MLGPLKKDHAPVRVVGLFAAKVAVVLLHIDCAAPAAEVVGGALATTKTVSVDAVHGALEMVQTKV